MGGVTGQNMVSRAYRAAEFPGAHRFANAHSIARMYAATVSDIDGIVLVGLLPPIYVAARMARPATGSSPQGPAA